jgi:pyrroline-5-carboxylate reductase
MLEEQSDAMEEIRTEQEEAMDITMTDNEETTAPPQQKQQEVTTKGTTTAMAARDFEQQFNRNFFLTEQKGSNAPAIGANRQ